MICLIFFFSEGREIQVIKGVSQKIGEFLNLQGGTNSFLDDLEIVKDVVIVVCVLYSFLIIVTALVRYINQSKNLNLQMMGKACLSMYISCNVVARLTMFIALFSTAEATEKTSPSIPLVVCAILAFFIFVMHALLILWYKWKFVPNFKVRSLHELKSFLPL